MVRALKWLLFVGVFGGLVGGAYYYQRQRDLVVPVKEQTVKKAPAPADELVCPGYVDAAQGVTPLTAFVPSRIVAVPVSENEEVKAGQVLVSFDDALAKQAVAEAQTLVNAAQQKWKLARRNPQRHELLIKQAQAAVDAAQAGLEVARHKAALQKTANQQRDNATRRAGSPSTSLSPTRRGAVTPSEPTMSRTAEAPVETQRSTIARLLSSEAGRVQWAADSRSVPTELAQQTAAAPAAESSTESKEEAAISDELVRQAEAMLHAEEAKLATLQLTDPTEEQQLLQADIDHAKAKLQQAQIALEQCSLKAPAAGTIARVLVSAGQVIGPMQPAIYFVPKVARVVRVEIEQAYVSHVTAGNSVRISEDRKPDRVWQGRVLRLSQWYSRPRTILEEVATLADIRTVECVVSIDDDASDLRIGQRVWARIKTVKDAN